MSLQALKTILLAKLRQRAAGNIAWSLSRVRWELADQRICDGTKEVVIQTNTWQTGVLYQEAAHWKVQWGTSKWYNKTKNGGPRTSENPSSWQPRQPRKSSFLDNYVCWCVLKCEYCACQPDLTCWLYQLRKWGHTSAGTALSRKRRRTLLSANSSRSLTVKNRRRVIVAVEKNQERQTPPQEIQEIQEVKEKGQKK